MALLEQTFLKPGDYHIGGGRFRTFTIDDLAEYRRNTLALMRRGYRVPVLAGHARAGATHGGPQHFMGRTALDRPKASHPSIKTSCPSVTPDPNDSASGRCVGWVVDLQQQADGSLIHVIEIPSQDDWQQIQKDGRTKASPELRGEFTDDQGHRYGPIIAHLALTHRPRNPNQSPLVPANEVYQFSLDDLTEGTLSMPQSEKNDTTTDATTNTTHPTSDPTNTPPVVVAAEAALDDKEVFSPESNDKTGANDKREPSVEAKRNDNTKTNDTPANDVTKTNVSTEADHPTESKTTTEESRSRHALLFRDELSRRIQQSRKLPKSLRERLVTLVETVQLSEEGDEEPTLRVSEAMAMFEEAMPSHLALAAERLDHPPHPRGESFFTGDVRQMSDEEATRIAQEQLANTGFAPKTK